MMAAAKDPFCYNTIEVPTVVGLLKNILTQYPDNGQIIKELVQNAEDAEASKVDVVHDTRKLQFPEAHQDIRRFVTGPALCFYNDAVFSEEDWQGIRKLSDSIKKDDPLKVGQFGLGFKSVFHMTDYITILSGSCILFMDPSEPEAKMCRSVALSALGDVVPMAASLQMWGAYLTSHHLATGTFPATLFWFPLRQRTSLLSSTIYSWDHVKQLFDSFSVEAPVCLTFLKSLEQLSLKRVNEDVRRPVVVHQVELMGPTLNAVQKKRRMLRKKLRECGGRPDQALTSHYHATIHSTRGTVVTKQTMLVLHHLPGQNDTTSVRHEGKNSGCHMPLVGIAAPIDPPDTSWARGHFFTFLPLPLDQANTTDLPVQVNAYFTLDQNRRHVKWRTKDTTSEPDVTWNEKLVSQVVLEAYHKLLLQVLNQALEGSCESSVWYSLLPDLGTTTGRWGTLARNLWKSVLALPILHSEVHGFQMPHQVITKDSLNNCSPKMVKCVWEVLRRHKKPLASLPAHVATSLQMLKSSPLMVTPQLVRDCLKSTGMMKPEWDRLTLLDYVTSDSKLYDLTGLPLLPLNNGTWTTFSKSGQQVFVCTADQARALWGLGASILLTDLPSALLQKLQNAAKAEITQLEIFHARRNGSILLTQCVQEVWKLAPSTQELQTWLMYAWSLIQELDLDSIAHLPLLPSSSCPSCFTDLMPLSSPVVVQNPESPLSGAAIETLSLLNVTVVPLLPQYIRHHQLHPYLHNSDGRGVSLALACVLRTSATQNLATSFNVKRSSGQSQTLVSILDPHSLPSAVKTLLAKLNIFRAVTRKKVEIDACVETVRMMSPLFDDFPVNFPETLLKTQSVKHHQLAQMLGAKQLSKKELCILSLENGYSDSKATKLAVYIMNDSSLMASQKIIQLLQRLKFVPAMNGILHLPSELYNPKDPDSDALIGEDLMPSHHYHQYLPVLIQLGLRRVADLPQNLLERSITHMQDSYLSTSDKSRKSAALLRVLEQRPDCQEVCETVRNVAFVYGVTTRPSQYPAGLTWATHPSFFTPASLKSYLKYRDVLGSVIHLVECSHLPKVAAGFGWNEDPNIHYFLEHLKNILAVCEVSAGEYSDTVKKVYKYLSSFISTSEAHHLNSLSKLQCVFTEYGFKFPNQVFITRERDDLQLLPYKYPLPYDLRECAELFKLMGCFLQQSVELYLNVLQQVQELHSLGTEDEEIKNDRRLVVSVLEKLEQFITKIEPSQLLLPVENDEDSLELVEKDLCSYSDQNCDWLSSDELEVRVVHRCVSARLACGLGVRELSQHLVDGGEAVMEWGQHEPLTTRLHNLLRHYRDGVAIMKELVQNADDAGATSVSFLYDERQNNDARTKLLNPQLGSCQGPALWSYNDATFTENDFHNLRDLGAGTKESQSTKIGKFGLGFCSVYNLTDVPSFVSGSNYVIFDPHQTYVDPENKTYGKRYNFEKRKAILMLKKLDGQFKPFHKVFDCNIQEANEFNGTLFRFPLRTIAQAANSKISNVAYGRTDMVQLLQMFREIVGEVLLYTQNIKEVKVFHLTTNASSPTEKRLLFESRKVSRGRPLLNNKQDTPLEKANALFTRKQSRFEWSGNEYQETILLDISVRNCQAGKELCGGKVDSWTVTWMTSWHSGKGHLCRLAEGLSGKALPLGAVSVPVVEGNEGWKPRLLSGLPLGFYKEGHLYCFLPLPVKTPLPLQVNGFFEVASDRTTLLYHTSDDRQALNWNTLLISDAVTTAYHTLLYNLISLGHCGTPYYALWPLASDSNDSHMTTLVKFFYSSVVKDDLKLFHSSSGWQLLSHCLFLQDSFYCVKEIGETAFEYMENMLGSSENQLMIELPDKIQAGFEKALISKYCVNQESFYQNYFIPSLFCEIVTPEKRDKLTLHMLDMSHTCMESLKGVACIPVQPNGRLRTPKDLIETESRVAEMFSVSDERFPQDIFLETRQRIWALLNLGMRSRIIPAEWVCDRAGSVAQLSCPECALARAKKILHYIGAQGEKEKKVIANKVCAVPFLPVMVKPSDWPYMWKGDQELVDYSEWCTSHTSKCMKSLAFASPSQLCLPEFKALVGSSHLILQHCHERGQDSLQRSVLGKLGLLVDPLQLPLQSVLHQLSEFTSTHERNEQIYFRCHAIYQHLEDFLIQNFSCSVELQELRKKKVLFTKYGFMEPELFAISNEADLSPDLFSATSEGLKKYRRLMKVLDIQTNFTFSVVMKVISKKIEALGTDILSKEDVSQMSKLLGELFKVRDTDSLNDQVSISSFSLPDARGCLHPVSKLCINDGANLSSGEFFCLHKGIKVSQEMLEWLDIKSKTRKRLEDSTFRLHFGQSESLTTRLRNILQDYPRDAGIMKELLQNADDAGATEVAFIKDLRNLPGEKLFDKKWAPLQGPALSVYNNKGFTSTDLHSIQDLGNSSKREDPASTGQYGIGFNAVYHLTDAPSFLTRGPEVPNGETLCMFDPHCRYDPWASVEKPGIQFQNLVNLRKDHPDSFIGYLENELLKEEGTVFRLPLRASSNSEISGHVMTKEMFEDMLEEFKREMSKCLLFLRNVHRITVMRVDQSGKCITEYSVHCKVSQESEMLNSIIHEKKQSTDYCKHLYALEMKRELYTMEITDDKGQQSFWYVVQQLGAENVESAPEIVKDAFHHGSLSLLPHAGVALLLKFKSDKYTKCDQLTTSCYLPLPSSSGLPFSINGHFTLISSRRDLWSGTGDAKAMWNWWLMKEVLVPAAAHALDHYRANIFSEERDTHLVMTEPYFKNKVNLFHRCLPNIKDVSSNKWKEFTRLFYEYVRDHQLHFFDVFIPESDKSPEILRSIYPNFMATNIAQEKPRRGKLEWHAFRETGNEFPVYFLSSKLEFNSLDTLKRLGMKVASEVMRMRMSSADPEYEYPALTPGTVLTFLLSWNKDFTDNCKPLLGLKIKETPFIEPNNVCSILWYVSQDENFETYICDLPLLLTNDDVLRCFSKEKPVFVTSYCSLLPKSGAEFLHLMLVSQVENKIKAFEAANIAKEFTIEDLRFRLSSLLNETYNSQEALIPLIKKSSCIPNSEWIRNVWDFMVKMTKLKFKDTTETPASIDWKAGKKYITETIGDWALYPVYVRDIVHLIPINNAWRVLDKVNFEEDSIFRSLPIFKPCYKYRTCIPADLKFAATKEDPQAVLEVLYFHRNEIDVYMRTEQSDVREILEYFGHHCKKVSLSQTKIAALSIFQDVTDQHCSLTGKKLIVHILVGLAGMMQVALKNGFVILKNPMSTIIFDLYKYIDPEILTKDLDIYSKFILPNLEFLKEKERIPLLENLRNLLLELEYTDESKWDESQVKVVSVLKRTNFLELDGRLVTAENFYDPTNNVFLVMKKCIVPQKWDTYKWLYILKLAGMIHTVTPKMFVEFASMLRISDPEVEAKSKALVQHLCENYESLVSVVTEIKAIEFLVPHKMENIRILETLLPYHKTSSGLVSFSKSVHSKFGKLLWSNVSLLPQYATSTPEDMKRFNISETAPEDKVLEHITNLCQALHSDGSVAGEEVFSVMEGIYEHLMSNEVTCESLKQSEVPVIHIPDHRTFVPASLAVENLEQEILPFLYQAPVRYGKFYVAFRRLGMVKCAICDTYAQVLERIFHASQQDVLNPEESKSMIMAMEGLLRHISNLGNLSVDILYLPTRDRKLFSSSKIFVADNQELLVAAQGKLNKPLFVGLSALDIYKDSCDFVKHLPERLQPKFLSDVVQEELLLDGVEEVSTPIFNQLKEVLNSTPLKTAILRVIHHFKMEEAFGLGKNEEQEIMRKLSLVAVKQLREITVIKKFQDDEIGRKKKLYYVKEEAEGNESLFTLYIPIHVSVMILSTALSELYKKLLNVKNADLLIPLGAIFYCILKPHDMHKLLDNFGIKDYESQGIEHRLFSFDIGSYLEERFLHLLDNKFGQFNVGEIVCMKKYICEDDDTFIIVQVCRLVDQSSICRMLDVYEVNMEERAQLSSVKAHQLYRFVRKPVGALILSGQAQDGTEEEEEEEQEEEEEIEVSEEEVRRKIRQQVREIWEVRDDLERRHLLRRLVFQWHPDKNPHRVDLCTRLVQYLQSLVGRLERGEPIPDDDVDEDIASEPSHAYQHTFRRPPPQYTGSQGTFGGSYERYASGPWDNTRRMGDLQEAQKWWRHANHDLDEAGRRVGGPACWVLYICHQAAEKFVKACLYSVNRDAAAEWRGEPLGLLCSRLSHHEASRLVAEVEARVVCFGRMRYPSYHGCPCDCYQEEDAEFVLGRVQTLKEVLATIFQAGED